MNRKWIWRASAALIVIVIGAFALRWAGGTRAAVSVPASGPADTRLAVAPLDVAVAGPAHLALTRPVSGSVEAARQVSIRSRHAGVAGPISRRAGESVRAGDVLVRIDSEELRLRAAEREAAVRQAAAALAMAESSRQQQRALADRGFLSQAALDAAENQVVAARSTLEAAQSQLSVARAALAEATLVSPIGGVVARRAVEPGERVASEALLFVVIDPDALEVSVQVPAERASELRVGQIARFQPSSDGDVGLSARLVRIVPSASAGARTVEARFALPPGAAVPAGAFLTGRLTVAERAMPVAVPRAAIRTDTRGHSVWAVRGGRADRVRVRVVDLDPTSAIVGIEEGLEPGTPVLLLRGVEPREGQAVQLPAEKAQAQPRDRAS